MTKEELAQRQDFESRISTDIAVMKEQISQINITLCKIDRYFDDVFEKLDATVSKSECNESRKLIVQSFQKSNENGQKVEVKHSTGGSKLYYAALAVFGSINVALIAVVLRELAANRELVEKFLHKP